MPEPELIWIIGASDGIGAAVARAWAKRGARLILSARSTEKLQSLATELGPEHVVLPLDIGTRSSVDEVAAKIDEIGPLSRVLHFAALYDPGKVEELDPVMAAKIITTNLTGSFHVAQVAPSLLIKDGQLAFCGSVAGYIGLPQGQIYSATKAGVINLAESLRSELAGQVDVRLVSPGFVDTRLTQRNRFRMPGLVTTEMAAQAILKGLFTRKFEIHFPKRLTLPLKLLRIAPYWISLPLTQRLTR